MQRLTIVIALATAACQMDVGLNEQCPDWHDHDDAAVEQVPTLPVDSMDAGERGPDFARVPGLKFDPIEVEPGGEDEPSDPVEPGDDCDDAEADADCAGEEPKEDEPDTPPEPTVELVPGNPDCADLGLEGTQLKIDPPRSGAYSQGELTVDFATDGTYFDFESNLPVAVVIAKGGPQANVFTFPQGATYEWGFHAPANASGKYADLSHATFCLSD